MSYRNAPKRQPTPTLPLSPSLDAIRTAACLPLARMCSCCVDGVTVAVLSVVSESPGKFLVLVTMFTLELESSSKNFTSGISLRKKAKLSPSPKSKSEDSITHPSSQNHRYQNLFLVRISILQKQLADNFLCLSLAKRF